MNDWLTLKTNGKQWTGPASAINAMVEDLIAKGEDFTVYNYNVTSTYKKTAKRKTQKQVDGAVLEVRNSGEGE